MINGMLVSGSIAVVIGMVMTFTVSLAMPFPWTLSQTLIAVAVASFVGSAISFQRGWSGGKGAGSST